MGIAGSAFARQWARNVAVVTMVGAIAACSHGVYHRVQPGETLYRISKAYGVPVHRLAAVNHLADPSRLEVNQRLFIPEARREVPVNIVTPRTASARPPQPEQMAPASLKFAWPVAGGKVTSGFGQRGRSFHDGIDISAPIGTPVHAAQDGEVIYSDVLRGYGNVVIVRHGGGFATVYAHNSRNEATEGQRVRQGQVICKVGDTGRTTSANLHFEVRQDNVARDPLYFLPPSEQVAGPAPAVGHGS